MSHDESRDEHRAQKRRAEIAKLRNLENAAVLQGRKLGPRDRLKAAFHLTRAWGEAKKTGLRKEDFQDEILDRLKRRHGSRQEFRLSNWILRRGEDPTTQPDLLEKYGNKTKPHKALESYFAGIAVAAEHCAVDADDWKLDMVRDLSIWSRTSERTDVEELDERPAETLAILLNALCSRLARNNRLKDTFETIRRMSCRWKMFDEQLVATDSGWEDPIESPISPVFEVGVHFEDMFPFPSVSLLRVPYVVGRVACFCAPDDELRILEARHDQEHVSAFSWDWLNLAQQQQNVDIIETAAQVIQYRDLRLTVVPDGHGGFAAALESRPFVEVVLDAEHPINGRHPVIGGYEPDLSRFFSRGKNGERFWPHIIDGDGRTWRVTTYGRHDDGQLGFKEIAPWIERELDKIGWYFDYDPVGSPGDTSHEPWYLSYTPATAPYIAYWLTHDWRLATEPAICPWYRGNFEWGTPEARWERNLPPVRALNFPDHSHATWIECCLHNGLIDEALQAKIDRLNEQTAALQAEWHAAREHHSNALLRRWTTATEGENRQ